MRGVRALFRDLHCTFRRASLRSCHSAGSSWCTLSVRSLARARETLRSSQVAELLSAMPDSSPERLILSAVIDLIDFDILWLGHCRSWLRQVLCALFILSTPGQCLDKTTSLKELPRVRLVHMQISKWIVLFAWAGHFFAKGLLCCCPLSSKIRWSSLIPFAEVYSQLGESEGACAALERCCAFTIFHAYSRCEPCDTVGQFLGQFAFLETRCPSLTLPITVPIRMLVGPWAPIECWGWLELGTNHRLIWWHAKHFGSDPITPLQSATGCTPPSSLTLERRQNCIELLGKRFYRECRMLLSDFAWFHLSTLKRQRWPSRMTTSPTGLCPSIIFTFTSFFLTRAIRDVYDWSTGGCW